MGRSLVDRALRRPEHHTPSPSCVCGIYRAPVELLPVAERGAVEQLRRVEPIGL